ncbi:MAG: hypothetical protein WCF85_15655 [Rhodospirillaceae bacterium]
MTPEKEMELFATLNGMGKLLDRVILTQEMQGKMLERIQALQEELGQRVSRVEGRIEEQSKFLQLAIGSKMTRKSAA